MNDVKLMSFSTIFWLFIYFYNQVRGQVLKECFITEMSHYTKTLPKENRLNLEILGCFSFFFPPFLEGSSNVTSKRMSKCNAYDIVCDLNYLSFSNNISGRIIFHSQLKITTWHFLIIVRALDLFFLDWFFIFGALHVQEYTSCFALTYDFETGDEFCI